MLIEKIKGNIEEIKLENRRLDEVLLDHYDMEKPHQKLTTQAGQVIALSLPHGEKLFVGAVIYEDETTVISVSLAEEEILRVCPKGNVEWARAAFNIGNMHQAAYVDSDCIKIPYDYVVESLLKNLGVEFFKEKGKLDGIRANVAVHSGGEHSHSHSSTHSHADTKAHALSHSDSHVHSHHSNNQGHDHE